MASRRSHIHSRGLTPGLLCLALGIVLAGATMQTLGASRRRGESAYPPRVVRASTEVEHEPGKTGGVRGPEQEAVVNTVAFSSPYGLAALANRALYTSALAAPGAVASSADDVAAFIGASTPRGVFRVGSAAPIFDEGLVTGWEDWSWGSEREVISVRGAPTGSDVLLVSFKEQWSGLYFHTQSFVPRVDDVLVFSIQTDDETPPALSVEFFADSGEGLGALPVADYLDGGILRPGLWQEVHMPLTDLRAAWGTTTGFAIVSDGAGEFFFDDVRVSSGEHSTRFLPPPPPKPQPITLHDVFGASSPYHAAPLWSGWRGLWGEHRIEDGALRITTEKPQTATLATLEGSGAWRDYEMSTRLNWHRGAETIETIVRFADERHYLACAWDYHGDHLHAEIREVRDGETFEVSRWSGAHPIGFYESWRDILLGVRIVDDDIVCLVKDDVVLRGTVPETAPERGGIALKTWEPEPGYTIVAIQDVVVAEVREQD